MSARTYETRPISSPGAVLPREPSLGSDFFFFFLYLLLSFFFLPKKLDDRARLSVHVHGSTENKARSCSPLRFEIRGIRRSKFSRANANRVPGKMHSGVSDNGTRDSSELSYPRACFDPVLMPLASNIATIERLYPEMMIPPFRRNYNGQIRYQLCTQPFTGTAIGSVPGIVSRDPL